MNPGWKQSQYGGSWYLSLGYGLQLVVEWKRSMQRDKPEEKYSFIVFSNKSKRDNYELAEAQEAAERNAKKILTDVIQKL